MKVPPSKDPVSVRLLANSRASADSQCLDFSIFSFLFLSFGNEVRIIFSKWINTDRRVPSEEFDQPSGDPNPKPSDKINAGLTHWLPPNRWDGSQHIPMRRKPQPSSWIAVPSISRQSGINAGNGTIPNQRTNSHLTKNLTKCFQTTAVFPALQVPVTQFNCHNT